MGRPGVVAFYKAKFGASEFQDLNLANSPVATLGRLVHFEDPVSGCKVQIALQSLGDKGTNVLITASSGTPKSESGSRDIPNDPPETPDTK